MVTGRSRDMECRVGLCVSFLKPTVSPCPDLSSPCCLHSFWAHEETLLMPIAMLWELQLFAVDPNQGGEAAVEHSARSAFTGIHRGCPELRQEGGMKASMDSRARLCLRKCLPSMRTPLAASPSPTKEARHVGTHL